jgi:4-alpha-glucanotransferase
VVVVRGARDRTAAGRARLGSEARMNLPGTDTGNWQWRYDAGALSDATRRGCASSRREHRAERVVHEALQAPVGEAVALLRVCLEVVEPHANWCEPLAKTAEPLGVM